MMQLKTRVNNKINKLYKIKKFKKFSKTIIKKKVIIKMIRLRDNNSNNKITRKNSKKREVVEVQKIQIDKLLILKSYIFFLINIKFLLK